MADSDDDDDSPGMPLTGIPGLDRGSATTRTNELYDDVRDITNDEKEDDDIDTRTAWITGTVGDPPLVCNSCERESIEVMVVAHEEP